MRDVTPPRAARGRSAGTAWPGSSIFS